MSKDRTNEIKNKAKEINSLSENFQMIHATYAVEEYIKDIIKNAYETKLDELNQKIKAKMDKADGKDAQFDFSKELEEKEELDKIIKRNHFAIRIGYINCRDPKIARVAKLNDTFIIYLAASLKDTIFTENGDYNYNVIQQIRKLMAHELGHLVLHTKELLQDNSTRGSLNIKDKDKEYEANLFGKELLDLRKERNAKISNDGGAAKLF